MRCKGEDLTIRGNESFGEFLRKKRLSMGLCQIDLADYLGVCAQTISRWELGCDSPSISKAQGYIEKLGGELRIVNVSDKFNAEPSDKDIPSRIRFMELEDKFVGEFTSTVV